MKFIKNIIKWFKDNCDKDLYFYYDEENVLTIGETEGRHL